MPNQHTHQPIAERFWSKVNKTETCWLWTAARFPGGYGQFQFNGRPHNAHRIAWILTNGPVAAGLFVCHKCDNRLCVRLSHMFLGTPLDNLRDAQSKGRIPIKTKFPQFLGQKGELNPRAKLTGSVVRQLRCRYAAGGTSYPKLAKEFGISLGVAFRAITGRSWQHIV